MAEMVVGVARFCELVILRWRRVIKVLAIYLLKHSTAGIWLGFFEKTILIFCYCIK